MGTYKDEGRAIFGGVRIIKSSLLVGLDSKKKSKKGESDCCRPSREVVVQSIRGQGSVMILASQKC